MKIKLLLSIALITTLAACGGAEERKAAYMEKAKVSIEAGNLDKARINLKNVLQIDPKDGEAYYQLGKVYEEQKEYRKAYGNYLKAEELSPELLANHAKLGRFYLVLMNDVTKTQEKIDLILSKEPDNADGLLLTAAVSLKNNKLNEALNIAKGIVASAPKHTESIAFLATLYIRDNNLTDAIKVLDTGIKNNQNNEQLSRLLAVNLLNNKEYERAEEIYKKFLERNPDNFASYNNLAVFYNMTENKVKAEETLRAAIENDPDDVDRILTLVKYVREIKTEDDAISELKGFIASNNGLGKLRTGLAELYFMTGDKQAAINVYKQATIDFSEEETGVTSRLALAAIHISEKEFNKASEVIEEAILISPNDPKVNMLRARLAVQDKDMEKAIISLRIVTKEEPENIDAYILLASVYQSEKNNEQAESTLNSAYANNKGNADALLNLAQYYSSRDIQKAEKIIDDYNNIKPSDYDGLSIKAALLNQNKKHEEAKKIAETLMETYPDKPNGYIQVIPYLSQIKDKNKAVSVLEKGYLNTKDNRKLLLLLTAFQTEDKKFDIVEKRIKAELNVTPKDEGLKLLLVKVYLANNEINAATDLLKEVVDNNSVAEEPYLILTQIYLSKEDKVKAIETLEKGYINTNNSKKILNSLTQLQVADKQFDVVENRINEELKAAPENEELKLLLSKVYLNNKKVDDAEKLLKDVVDNDSVSEEAYLLLARIYQNKKESDTVEALLLKGKKNIPASAKISFGLAALYESKENYSEAIDIYRELYLSQPDNIVVVNNLASLLSDHGNGKSDLELARTLADKLLDNKQPVFLDTIGWVSYKLGDYQNAITYLKQVVEQHPEVNVFSYHLGMAYKMSGDKANAKLYLEKSLADKKPFKEKELAEAALKEI